MRILSGNDAASPLDSAERRARKKGAGFGAWFMGLLRGVDAPTQEAETSAHRRQCPFYGFVGMAGVAVDSNGNACALMKAHMPCSMEMGGRKPCWDSCIQWNNERKREDVREFLSGARVFPKELMPKDGNGWEGIDGLDWFRRVMGRSYPWA